MRIPPMTLGADDVAPPAPPGHGPGWVADAACAGASTERWFDGDTSSARAVCRSCPVAGPCAEYALTERLTHGVWGGLTGEDRQKAVEARGIVWKPEPPVRKSCGTNCDQWARPGRTLCSRCAHRAYRASRR